MSAGRALCGAVAFLGLLIALTPEEVLRDAGLALCLFHGVFAACMFVCLWEGKVG